ncbi:MAG: tetratricopeptide repeat protein [Bacteroidales bacterium]|nr:tetratricopeptide repeat protein [Candidatus Cacconaster merdequi]
MKRTLIALSLILSATMMSAQPKSVADAQKLVSKAEAASQDAKKAAKFATWISLADAYLGAYDQPTRNLIPNTPQMEVKLFLKDQKILETKENFKGAEGVYTVDVYADKELYYNNNGILEMWIVTKPAVEGDLLGKAQAALEKAFELDVKKSKSQDIIEKMESIHNKFSNEALSYYLAGDFDKACELFKATCKSYDNPVLGKIDSLNLYYTAMVSGMAGKKDQAIDYYNKCIDLGFYQEGSTFSNLAAIHLQAGDTLAGKATLEKGFQSYPQSQGILVGLINLYRENNEDPAKLFDLLHQAQANEPNNASLYYCEGDIYKQFGDVENAAKMFKKSSEVNPDYIFGTLGVGMLYYDNAVAIQEKAAEEVDDAKYMALVEEIEDNLQKALEPFETAYSKASNEPEIQKAVAQYLKNIYFRLRDKNEAYPALYEKYNELAKEE